MHGQKNIKLILNCFKNANTNKTATIYTFSSIYYVYVMCIAEKLWHPQFVV